MTTRPLPPALPSQDAIVARIDSIKDSDFFGFETGDLLVALDLEHARPYLDPETLKQTLPEGWKVRIATPADALRAITDYMPFAWDKATNHRGLSAGRSLSHMSAWLWLLGDEEAVAFLADDDHNYRPYGAPSLAYICKRYGLPMPDDTDALEMAAGRPCHACASGERESGCT